MAQRVIKQPDGNYAIWSTIVDDFVVFDATVDEVHEYLLAEEVKKIEQNITNMLSRAQLTDHLLFSQIMYRDEVHGPVEVSKPEDKEFAEWLNKWRNSRDK